MSSSSSSSSSSSFSDDSSLWSHESLKKQHDELRDLLRCPICLDLFKRPTILPCLHSFCFECIIKHAATPPSSSSSPSTNSSHPKCPICRQVFNPSPQKNLKERDALKPNSFFEYQLNRLTQIKSNLRIIAGNSSMSLEIKRCDACLPPNQEDAFSRCVDCKVNLCENHEADHANHKVLNLADLEEEETLAVYSPLPPVKICKVHPDQTLTMECLDCLDDLCAQCESQGLHKNHRYQRFEDYYQELKTQYAAQAKSLQTQRRDVASALYHVDHMIWMVEGTQEDIIEQANKDFDKEKTLEFDDFLFVTPRGAMLYQLAKVIKKDVLAEVDRITKTKLEMLQKQRKQLEADLDALEVTLHMTRSILKHAPPHQLNEMIILVFDRWNHFSNKKMYHRPVVTTLPYLAVSNNERKKRLEAYIEDCQTDLVTVKREDLFYFYGEDSEDVTIKKPVLVFGHEEYSKPIFSSPKKVIVDKDNNILVCDSGNSVIKVFTEKGEPIRTISTPKGGHSAIINPLDIAISKGGLIFLGDHETHRVQMFSTQGKHIRTLGGLGTKKGRFSKIVALDINNANNIVVGDDGTARIQVIDQQGRFIKGFGGSGKGPGKFDMISGITVDKSNDNIVVCDLAGQCIQVLDAGGNHIKTIAKRGTNEGELHCPSDVAIDQNHNYVVCDSGNHRIQIFDRNWNFLSSFGELGNEPGEFNFPRGVTVDNKNRIIVCDTNNNRIQIFE